MRSLIRDTDIPASNFLMEADRDYLGVRLLFCCSTVLHNLCGYHSQQALEKYIKALTVQDGGKYMATHDLEKLRAFAATFRPYFSSTDVKMQLARFNCFDQISRYGAEANFDPHRVDDDGISVRGVFVFSGGLVKLLDKLVFEIRGFINIAKLGWADSLRAILDDDKTNLFNTGWKIPIRSVLVSENDYFK